MSLALVCAVCLGSIVLTFVYVRTYVRARVCVCVPVRERERESICVCVWLFSVLRMFVTIVGNVKP